MENVSGCLKPIKLRSQQVAHPVSVSVSFRQPENIMFFLYIQIDMKCHYF
ncbi:MAG: hypothetical protein IKZ88_01425 [Neisseriaceae bacterium]|nr:hypothetical protein [Neisseriaceae bacterium]